MNEPIEIYVKLLHEAVDVWRPVMAQHITGDVYEIGEPPKDSDEVWEFTNQKIICKEIILEGNKVLAATRVAF